VKEPVSDEFIEKCRNRYFQYRPEGRNESYYKLLYSLRKPLPKKDDNSDPTRKHYSPNLGAFAFFREFQAPDGRWFSEDGTLDGDLLVTSLVVLSMLDFGQTHRHGKYKHVVRKALEFIKSETGKDGHFSDDTVVQAVCVAAICSLCAITADKTYMPLAENSLENLFSRQIENGGFPERKGGIEADIRSAAYSMLALYWANFGKLDNLEKKRQNLLKYFENNNDMIEKPQHAAMTYASCVYLGWKRRDVKLVELRKTLDSSLPSKDRFRDAEYIWWGTEAMFLNGGRPWQSWNKAMRETVTSSHITEGSMRGSWNPDTDDLSKKYGRIYATAMHVLILEVYYIVAKIPKWESDK
jgi:hypothetical protein